MTGDSSSRHSLIDATKSRATFSAHNKSLGASGFISPYDEEQRGEFLSEPGETAIVNPPENGLPDFEIGVAWDNVPMPKKPTGGLINKLLGKKKPILKAQGVDLDLGCLYELKNGKRGAIQAFGDNYGAFKHAPFIELSGDERTGDAEGEDELITINGAQWNEISKIVIYIYIYSGADSWQAVKPQIQVRVPGEKPMIVSLHAKRQELALCAVASLENIRKGIKMTNHLEYFPGHAEMDRAFGFGLDWDDGQKQPR
jgi:tellurite resistance protein TerA